jgi:hypothetical protein
MAPLVRTIVIFAISISCFGQGNTFRESYEKARQLAQQKQLEEARIKLEQDRIKAVQEIYDKALSLEQQRLKTSQQAAAVPPAADSARFEKELQAALPVLAARYPDLELYAPEMIRLGAIFAPSNSPQTTGEVYLEGLYALAKHARFSSLAGTPQIAEKPLDNEDVVGLVRGGLSEATILAKIRTSTPNFRLDAADLIGLKAANVSETILQAMIEARSNASRNLPI